MIRQWRSIGLVSIIPLLLMSSLNADAAPARRGPMADIIRPSLKEFTNHPEFESKERVTLDAIVRSTWAGTPVNEENRPLVIEPMADRQPMAWDTLRREQAMRFSFERDRLEYWR